MPEQNFVYGNGQAGIVVEGASNFVQGNEVGQPWAPNGSGIVVRGTDATIWHNELWSNAGDGIVLTQPARVSENTGGCDGGAMLAGRVMAAPIITTARLDPSVLVVQGTFHGEPDATYRIELHEAPRCNSWPSSVVASGEARTDAAGTAAWQVAYRMFPGRAPIAEVFAVANRIEARETSAASAHASVSPAGESTLDLDVQTQAPAEARPGQVIELLTVVTNKGPAGVAGVVVDIPAPAGVQYVAAPWSCEPPNGCAVGALAPGQKATIRQRVRITATAGMLTHSATISSWIGTSIETDQTNQTSSSVVALSNHVIPTLSPPLLALLVTVLALLALNAQRS